MKKAILVALAILLALLMALWPADAKPHSIKGSEQQKTQDTYKVSAFTELMVQGQIEIEFTQSSDDAYTVAYNGPYNLAERIEIANQEGTLSIRYDKPLLVLGDQHIRVQVTAPDLKRIVVQDGAEVHAHMPLSLQDLVITATGKSEVELDEVQAQTVQAHLAGDAEVDIGILMCQMLHVKTTDTASFDAQRADCDSVIANGANRSEIAISGLKGQSVSAQSIDSAEVEIKGKVSEASLIARGHSNIDAGSLQAITADVMAERSAQIKVRVSDTLNAQAQGRGVVQYKGWPQIINKTGKGTVKQDK